MFERLLIANRGEIAVRVIRACRELGIESVAVYSDADADALHVLLADRAVLLGPAQASASYLAIPRIIDAARRTGAQAVHPGYGFLSENAAFAQACADAGLVFVGPPPDAIARMGSKIEARRLAQRAGVPVVPGDTPAEQADEAIAATIERVGLPVLLKPSGGGGGIGMRIVREPHEIADQVRGARRDALGAFGDPTLYVERLVERPRHVEFQVLADAHGAVVHLFERECSLQRRHQKVIEESPSVALTPRLRERMGAAAIAVTRAAGYRNAGTIEFLLDGAGDEAPFYFLEMNTRLQVEHPVTEAVTGLDLVHAQLRIAAGEPLPWTQAGLQQRGHAVECRVYAEDPAQGFLPQAGPLLLYREPRGPGIRVDVGVAEGDAVSVHYDPLLAKLVVQGESREVVIRRAAAALREFAVLGIPTNIAYLLEVLQHPAFIAGEVDTRFLDRETPALVAAIAARQPPAAAIAAAAASFAPPVPAGRARGSAVPDPWTTLQGWRPGS
jgi:acetyl-CoA/propionyl-CoA carboxylase, biotin carboxylase, biotin carboxyl carrier protein